MHSHLHRSSTSESRLLAGAVVVALAVVSLFLISPAAHAAWSWSQTGSGTPGSSVYSLVWDGTTVYAGCSNGRVYQNDLGGAWTQTGSNAMAGSVDALLMVGDKLYAGCGNGTVYQNDLGGGAWIQAGTNTPGAPVNALLYDGEDLYAGCQNGTVYQNDLGGEAWAPTGTGPPPASIQALAYDGSRLYAGCQDGTVYKNDLSGGNWGQAGADTPGSGSIVYTLAYDGNRLYAGCQNGKVYQNDLGGGFWGQTGSNAPGAIVKELFFDGARLYAGCQNGTVYQNDLAGGTWTQTGDSPPGSVIDAMDGSGTRLFTGCNNGAVYDIRNGFTVTAQVQGYGTATPSSQTVPRLRDATVTINPHDQCHVASVTDNGATVTPTPQTAYTIEGVTSDHDVVVSFEPDSNTWYLAEGTSAWGFSTYITIENPNPDACTASITYNTNSGAVNAPDVALPAMSQTTINPETVVTDKDFSTVVTCREGKAIAVDRTMTWTGPGAQSPEAHNSVGVTSPAKTWYLPEGSSEWGFETWLLLQNPNGTEATVDVTYMTESEGPIAVRHTVPANSRRTFDMAGDIGAKDASIKVDSNVPVIPERAMYRNDRREGHDSIGTTTPALSYYLAEGTSAWGFTTYVLVQNPQAAETEVTVTYMTDTGPVTQEPFVMPANSRKTIRVNDVLPERDFSTRVTGSRPIIAERAMYWDNGTGEACHDSIGMDAPHKTFYLPDGETSNGRETYTLVQNPNSSAVVVEVSYLTPTGEGNVVFTDTVPPDSRRTYSMGDRIASGRAAVMVTSKTAGKKIMVERAMYWNSRGVGTDTIGGYWD